MIFIIQTNDEVAGIDVTLALSSAGIEHTIISKQNDDATPQGVQGKCPCKYSSPTAWCPVHNGGC